MSSEVQPKCTMAVRCSIPMPRQPAADVVLHGLDVVHRDGLDLGQFGDGRGVEFGDDRAQLLLLLGGQRPGAGQDAVAGQVDQPFHLDGHPVAVQGRLGEVVHQRRDGGLVAAVQRAERDLAVRRGEGQASGRRVSFSHGAYSFTNGAVSCVTSPPQRCSARPSTSPDPLRRRGSRRA